MVGKTRAWVRKKIGKLRRLYHKKGPTTYAEDASLILVLSLSERSPEPQPDLNRLENISSEVPQDAIPRALMRPYSGAYPSSYPSPRPESVAPTKRRLGRMQRSLGCNPPPEFQYMKDNSESEQRAVRQQASAMSANTIGWDTPIGNYAGGKQVLLHPTGLCELRRPESAARMQEMEQVADYDFRCKVFMTSLQKHPD